MFMYNESFARGAVQKKKKKKKKFRTLINVAAIRCLLALNERYLYTTAGGLLFDLFYRRSWRCFESRPRGCTSNGAERWPKFGGFGYGSSIGALCSSSVEWNHFCNCHFSRLHCWLDFTCSIVAPCVPQTVEIHLVDARALLATTTNELPICEYL